MFMEIPTVARCCCCAPLRYGILVWAYIKLVTSIIALALSLLWSFVWLYYVDDDIPMILLIISTMISIVIDVVFNFILILGAHKKNLALLEMYYRYAFAHAVVFVLLGLLWMSYGIATAGRPLHHPDVVVFIVAMALSIAIPLLLHIYLFIVLRSEINKLKSKEHMHFANPLPEAFGETEIQTMAHNQTEDPAGHQGLSFVETRWEDMSDFPPRWPRHRTFVGAGASLLISWVHHELGRLVKD